MRSPRRRWWFAIGLLPLLGGCATGSRPISVDEAALARVPEDTEIAVVQYPPPPFREVDPTAGGGWAALGLLGIIPAIVHGAVAAERGLQTGEQLRATYALEDPAVRVTAQLVERLRTRESLARRRFADPRVLTTDDPVELARTLGPRLALDVRTLGWSIVTAPKLLPFTTERYQVAYGVRARFLHLAGPTILWEGRCASTGREGDGKWTLEELTTNGAVRLKARLVEAADACVQTLAGGPGRPTSR
jgi:hypothetical protein